MYWLCSCIALQASFSGGCFVAWFLFGYGKGGVLIPGAGGNLTIYITINVRERDLVVSTIDLNLTSPPRPPHFEPDRGGGMLAVFECNCILIRSD